MVAFGDDGRFAEGPAEIGVTEFGAAQTFNLTGTGDGAFDQAAVREEIFDGGETLDVTNLVEDGQAEGFADTGDALEQDKLAGGDAFGLALKFLFELEDLLVEVADHGQVVLERDLAQRVIFGLEQLLFPGVANATGLFNGGAIVGQLVGMDASQEFGATPDIGDALAQKRAQGSLGGGINVRGWDEVGAQEVRELLGVNAVVFVFAAVDEVEIERVSQDESEAGLLAGVGQPISAEHAFSTHGEIVPIRFDELEEVLKVIVLDVAVDQFLALPIHDADVHLVCVQIDSAVELCGGGIILHTLMQ